jgi:hypothetical protein
LKRLLALCLVIILAAQTLALIPPAQAGVPLACSTLTLQQPHSEACAADIEANPAPELVRPVAFDPKMHGVSHPRSVLMPKTPLPYPIGWIVRDWPYSDKPGADPGKVSADSPRMYHKATLIYIYATVNVNNIDWYLVGPDRWIPGEYISLLNIPKRPDGVTGHWIALDLSQQTLLAFDGDTPIFATLISAAYRGFGVTRPGLFHIYARTKGMIFRGPPWKAVPDYIIDHVPNVMFFDGNIALHGAYWHDKFGIPLTHGCVNVPVGDEQWLWNWVSETSDQWGPAPGFFLPHPEKAPFVYVYHSSKYSRRQE